MPSMDGDASSLSSLQWGHLSLEVVIQAGWGRNPEAEYLLQWGHLSLEVVMSALHQG